MEQDMKDVVAESNKDKQETSDEEEKDESSVPLSDYLSSSFEEEDGDLKDKGMAQVFFNVTWTFIWNVFLNFFLWLFYV